MNYDEGTAHIDRLLPLMGKKPTHFRLSQQGLPSDDIAQVESRLYEEGLAIKHTGRVVSLTTEGMRIAQLGAGGYRRVLQEKKREKEDPLKTNRVTRWTARFSLLISCVAAFIAYKEYRKPDSNEEKIESLTRIQQSYQIELSAIRSQIHGLNKTVDSFRLAASMVTTAIDTVRSQKTLHVLSKNARVSSEKGLSQKRR